MYKADDESFHMHFTKESSIPFSDSIVLQARIEFQIVTIRTAASVAVLVWMRIRNWNMYVFLVLIRTPDLVKLFCMVQMKECMFFSISITTFENFKIDLCSSIDSSALSLMYFPLHLRKLPRLVASVFVSSLKSAKNLGLWKTS